MKKILAASAVSLLALFLISTSVFAFGGGFGPGQEPCLQDVLDDDQKAVFVEIMEEFRAKMEALREELWNLRAEGDYEAFREKQEERVEIRTERNEKLSELLPEEYSSRFQNCGGGMRHHGLEKNGGWFGNQNGS